MEPLSAMKTYHWENNTLDIQYENGHGVVEVLTDDIFRIYVGQNGEPTLSVAVEGDKKTPVEAVCEASGDSLVVRTRRYAVSVSGDFRIDILDSKGNRICEDYREERTKREVLSDAHKELLIAEGHAKPEDFDRPEHIFSAKKMDGDEKFYGLGDKTGFLNKRSYEFENWNTDNPKAHTEAFAALYKSIPFLIVLKEKGCYGLFYDNTYRSRLNLGKEREDYFFYAADGGTLNYYFIGGRSMKEVVSNYTYLTGTTPLPQRWVLGYHQSRWGYDSAEVMRTVASKMRELEIPCDCLHFDIDYMEGFRVFTWNEKRYGEKGKLIEELLDDGFRSVCIIDPGVKKDEDYAIYREGVENDYFAKSPDGTIYNNVVWPGVVAFPDFGNPKTRDWWAQNQKFLMNMKVGGVWNDMNEPASFEGELPLDVVFSDEGDKITHEKMHNRYGHLMSKATYEGIKAQTGRRPFVITRACYAGTQKYSTVWTGDNQSLWAHLQMAIPQLCNLGISGIGIAGTDVGGFGADTTPELMARWVQVGAVSPFFRNHCSNGCIHQEPWEFPEEIQNIYRKFTNLRYELLPYFYDCMKECEETGIPMMRPLVLEYEHDAECFNCNDEFMVGDRMLVAPVVTQGSTKRVVYLPEGTWYGFEDEDQKRYDGGQYYLVDAPLDTCPIFVKEGTILPTYAPMQYIGETCPDKLILRVYPGEGSYIHYQDNGLDFDYRNGAYNRYRFTKAADGTVSTELLHEGFPQYGEIEVK